MHTLDACIVAPGTLVEGRPETLRACVVLTPRHERVRERTAEELAVVARGVRGNVERAEKARRANARSPSVKTQRSINALSPQCFFTRQNANSGGAQESAVPPICRSRRAVGHVAETIVRVEGPPCASIRSGFPLTPSLLSTRYAAIR